ncbi:hypothetical protein D9619_010040 [Psilocybe cf. subviscida]|uniref:F-box domain-containing protein n=1 Tax=Psilocybe cf. subviscida TaxID=2480587 RepID=A0A8H5BLQ4_9AGAR|nr:hypothetical protein D9619_010040 [Psilocybe cf. subviscida]
MATHNSCHEAQMLIDKKIADLTARTQDSIRLLKTRRNELASVCKLPDEILQCIFLILRDSTDLHPKNWHHVTDVCRHWRHVAIGSPSLWTRLRDFPPALTRLMLERSQNAPLDVRLTFRCSITTLAAILHEVERIRTLDFDGMHNVLDTVYDILAGLGRDWEASLLQSLTIHTAGYNTVAAPASVKILADVFHPTRRLRRLSLINAYYDGSMFPLPSVTHLCLYGRPLGDVSGAQFTETLHQMQNLQALEISLKDTNIRQFLPTPRPRPIHFPCLRRLEISDGDQDLLEPFLSLVTHPRLHQLQIIPSSLVTNVVTFIKLILSSIGKANFGLLEFLTIKDQDVTLSTSPEVDIFYYDELSSFITTWISTSAHDDDCGTTFRLVADVMSCLSPVDLPDRIRLRYISMDSSDAPIAEFTRLFASLPHLETIKVYHKTALVLFKAMNITSTSDSAIPTTPIPFPKLQTIIWHNHDHTEDDWHSHIETDTPLVSSTTFSDLYSGLLSRRAHGVPIIKLELGIDEVFDDIQSSLLKGIGIEVVIK